MPKTPTPMPAKGKTNAESPAVVKARTAVNAAAADFETARQTMADAGEALNASVAKKSQQTMDLSATFSTAKDAYTAAGAVLGRAQKALTDAQAVKK